MTRRTWLLLLLIALAVPYGIAQLSKFPRWQLFGDWIYRLDTSQKVVALTFDDGPRTGTHDFLDMLAALQLPATFFVVGGRVDQYPEIIRRMMAEGHEVGNHSYSHTRLVLMRASAIREEVGKTDDALRRAGVQGEIHFRAPYGQKLVMLPWVLREQGKWSILWDVNAGDLEIRDPAVIVERVVRRVRPGSIVLMHQNDRSLRAVPRLAEQLRDTGYRFVTISEILRPRVENNAQG